MKAYNNLRISAGRWLKNIARILKTLRNIYSVPRYSAFLMPPGQSIRYETIYQASAGIEPAHICTHKAKRRCGFRETRKLCFYQA